jgi:hypothetical protein
MKFLGAFLIPIIFASSMIDVPTLTIQLIERPINDESESHHFTNPIKLSKIKLRNQFIYLEQNGQPISSMTYLDTLTSINILLEEWGVYFINVHCDKKSFMGYIIKPIYEQLKNYINLINQKRAEERREESKLSGQAGMSMLFDIVTFKFNTVINDIQINNYGVEAYKVIDHDQTSYRLTTPTFFPQGQLIQGNAKTNNYILKGETYYDTIVKVIEICAHEIIFHFSDGVPIITKNSASNEAKLRDLFSNFTIKPNLECRSNSKKRMLN